jgi:molybdate transport system substrate-binding protein
VAVAANAQFVAEALKASFEKETNIEAQLIVSSSGKLTTQIQQGAPFDVFLSADMKYPQALYDGKLTEEKPKVYAFGVLVMWSLKDQIIHKGLQTVNETSVKKIAIANPKLAPYGEAAVQALRKTGVYEQAKSKLVYAESIAGVNQYLLTGVVDLAFTAKSVVRESSMQNKGKWVEVDQQVYSPIAQGVVLLKSAANRNQAAARQFYNFLFTPKARNIFQTYGYRLP